MIASIEPTRSAADRVDAVELGRHLSSAPIVTLTGAIRVRAYAREHELALDDIEAVWRLGR